MKKIIYLFTVLFSVLVFLPRISASETEVVDQYKDNVCVACHEALDGKMSEPVHLWKQSFHYRMGNACEGCHGGDSADENTAMSPEKGFVGAPKEDAVAEFCGKCHVGVKENYLKSAHYLARSSGKKAPTCTTCHNSHDVKQASLEMINESLCARCHSYEQAQEIKKSFVAAELKLESEKEALTSLADHGMDVKRQQEKIFALRNSLHQMTHTLDVPLIKSQTGSVIKDLDDIHQRSEELRGKVVKRWWIGGGVGLFFLITVIMLVIFKKNLLEEEE